MKFDFDAWSRLAKDDPEHFERRRLAVVRATIAAAPKEHRARLERMQFSLDLVRERDGTPLKSCSRMHSLMWTGLFWLRKELDKVPKSAPEAAEPKRSAQVIPFKRPRETHGNASSEER